MAGFRVESLEGTDDTDDGDYRIKYFLRRMLGTLVEFAEAFRLIETSTSRSYSLSHLAETALQNWRETVEFFSKQESFLKLVRNDLGGHFGTTAAKYSLESLGPRTTGRMEVRGDFVAKTANVYMHLVGEITARAFFRHVEGHSIEERAKKLMDIVEEASQFARRSVEGVFYFYILPRLEKG